MAFMLLFACRHVSATRHLNVVRNILKRRISSSRSSQPKINHTGSTTLDQEELQRFKSLPHDFWWKSQAGAPLRSMNELRIPLIRDAVSRPVPSRLRHIVRPLSSVKLLDVGSGGGLVSEPLARLGADVTGIDPVQENVDNATRHLNECSSDLTSNLKYFRSSVEDFAAIDTNAAAFDAVVASEVMEHVDDVPLFLNSIHRLLRSNGKLVITTINQTLASQILAICVAENILHLVPKGTHSYHKLIPLEGLLDLLQETGFVIESVQGMAYEPFSNNWFWCRSTSINFAVVAVKL